MPRGQSSGPRALAHLLAAHSSASPKQAKEPIFAVREDEELVRFIVLFAKYLE